MIGCARAARPAAAGRARNHASLSESRTVAPKARTVEITFDRFVDINGTPLVWAENIMQMTGLGLTFVEQDGGLTHILSGGFFTGDPQEDTSTGEISGLGLAADSYQTITNT